MAKRQVLDIQYSVRGGGPKLCVVYVLEVVRKALTEDLVNHITPHLIGLS